MARSSRPTRITTPSAIFALATAVMGSLLASGSHAQLADGTFDLDKLSQFGTDDGGIQLDLPFFLKFGDAVYSDVHVNNNGLISFGGFIPGYTNDNLDQVASDNAKAIVAPFFADVDTRPDSENVGGEAQVGTGTVDGRSAFIATWDRVGRADRQFDRYSTFEVLFIDRSDVAVGDFDIVFNYGDIEWTVANEGDTPARVGFAVPGGQSVEFDLFGELPPPTIDADLLLAPALASANGPIAVTASPIVFEVRDGAVGGIGGNVVPTPTAAAAGLVGLIVLNARRRRAVSA